MLSIAIYTSLNQDNEKIKSIIQDFLIAAKTMAKVSFYNSPDAFITAPSSYDIYIMDMDSEGDILNLGAEMKKIDIGAKFIYLSSDPSTAPLAAKALVDYYVIKPFTNEEIINILLEIKKTIQEESIIIKIPSGERRIRTNNLNYINIVKRCLCYHLTDGTMFDGQVLRSSFEKTIYPLNKKQSFLFLPPSLLINLNEIKIVNSDNIIFDNEDILFFPKKHYETVRAAWFNCNRIIE